MGLLLYGDLLSVGDSIPCAKVLEHLEGGDIGVSDLVLLKLLDVLIIDSLCYLFHPNGVDGVLEFILPSEDLVICLFFAAFRVSSFTKLVVVADILGRTFAPYRLGMLMTIFHFLRLRVSLRWP